MNRAKARETAVAQDLLGIGFKSTNMMTSALGQTPDEAGVGRETVHREGDGPCPWETTVLETVALQNEGHWRSGQNDSGKSEGMSQWAAQVVHCTRCQPRE